MRRTSDSMPSVTATTLFFASVHFLQASLIPLVQDEAYYTLWSRDLDWGYYDHPPMIAWWIAAGRAVFGETELAVRLISVLAISSLGIMGAAVAYIHGSDERSARIAALFTNGTVAVFGLGFVATPDAPSAFFWMLAVLAALKATQRDGNRSWMWWVILGASAGAGVISKLTGLFLGVGLVAWLLGTVAGRRWLRRPEPWISGLIAFTVITPYLTWNYSVDWLGFERQLGRVRSNGFTPNNIAGYLALVPLVVSPMIAWAAARSIKSAKTILLLLNLPVLAYFLWHSTHAQVQGNWLIPLCAPLAAIAAIHTFNWGARRIYLATGVGPLIVSVLLALAFLPGARFGTADNPPNQTIGWADTSSEISSLIEAVGAEWIATDHYGLAGLFSWYLNIEVRDLKETYRYSFIEPLENSFCARPGLLILRNKFVEDDALYSNLRSLGVILRQSAGKTLALYHVYAFDSRMECAS